jgi:hypothetical protein
MFCTRCALLHGSTHKRFPILKYCASHAKMKADFPHQLPISTMSPLTE